MRPGQLKPTLMPSQFEEMIDLSSVLKFTFYIALVAISLISLNMLQDGIELSDISTFILLAVTLFWFIIYQTGRHKTAGWGLILSISIVIAFNLGVEGGIHDNGMVIFPVLIILAGLIFGKGIITAITALTMAEVLVIYWLTLEGIVRPFGGAVTTNLQQFLTVMILLLVSGVLIWITLNVIENNIQKILESEEDLRLSYDDTIDGWGRALELFDRETEGHSRRVTALTLEIAQELGFNEEELEHIRRGALLHDIGKMGISDEILNKPGKLDPDERLEIEEHPLCAYEMLKDIPFLEKALEIPLYHHERWDGTGYPHNMAAEEIPLSARIFTIADHYDALTSDRPYRKAWSQEKTLQYLRDNNGKIFDPEILEIFLERVAKEGILTSGITNGLPK